MPIKDPKIKRADRFIAFTLSLLLLTVYLTTTTLRFHSIDGEALFSTTRSLVGHGTADSDALYWLLEPMGRGSVVAQGQDGHMYSVKDIGLSIVAIPFVWFAKNVSVSPIRTAMLVSPMATAFTAGLLYLMVRSWGYRQRTGLYAGLLFGLGSMSWPFAETFYTQPLSGLGLMLALFGVWQAYSHQSWKFAMMSGIGLGLSGTNAMATWISGPVYLLFLVYWGSPNRQSWGHSVRHALPLIIAFSVGAIPFLSGQVAYNLFRFGSPFSTGFDILRPNSFSLMNIPTGLLGMLFSTSRGVVWYAPFTLLIPFGINAVRRKRQSRFWFLALTQVVSILIVYTTYEEWWGGLAWGPRFMVTLMPALVLLIVPFLDEFLDSETLDLASLGTGILLIISGLVQFAASVLKDIVGEEIIFTQFKALAFPHTLPSVSSLFFDPGWLPQVRLLETMPRRKWDMLWLSGNSPDWWLLGTQVFAILLGIVVLWYFVSPAPKRLPYLWTAVHVVIVIILVGMILTKTAVSTNNDSGLVELKTALDEQAGEGECILTILPRRYQLWLDSYIGPLPDIGMMFESPLSSETDAMLDRVEDWCHRVWLVSEETVFGNSANGVEHHLATVGYMGTETWFEDWRLVPYSYSTENEEVKPIGKIFKDAGITLVSAAIDPVISGEKAWLNVRLCWTAAEPTDENYSIFVHLFNDKGILVSQQDGPPGAGFVATSTWGKDKLIDDRHQLILPSKLVFGDYTVAVGIYEWQTNERLLLSDGSDDKVILGTISFPLSEKTER